MVSVYVTLCEVEGTATQESDGETRRMAGCNHCLKDHLAESILAQRYVS